jgi:hypothetical protein
VGEGVYELKIHYGPGYRVYYSLEKKTVVLLLLGGDKSSQKYDIAQAKVYWQDYSDRATSGESSLLWPNGTGLPHCLMAAQIQKVLRGNYLTYANAM